MTATASSGRTIRVVLGILGLDQHEAGALAVSRILRDRGFEVIYMGRFQLPDGLAAVAIAEDADVVGVSCHSWEFLYYVSDLVEALNRTTPRIPVIVGGSVVTPEDAERVLAQGVQDVVLKDRSPEEIVEAFLKLAQNAHSV